MATNNGWNNTVSAAAVTLNGGAVNIGTDNAANAISIGVGTTARTIGMGNSAAAHALTLGSTNTTAATVIQSGSGNIACNAGFTVDSTGRTTNTAQPAFLAYLGTSDSNVTGDGTQFQIGSGNALTKVFDQGTNFNTNGTFTAPVTGKYQFNFTILFQNTLAASTIFIDIIATSRAAKLGNTAGSPAAGNNPITLSALIDMTASDTATFQVAVGGGTKTVSIFGNGSTDERTYMSAFLVC